jgi:serine/threonine protein kinase
MLCYIVHGDLTTSNIMVRDSDRQVVLIDFGLGATQSIIEDKAVGECWRYYDYFIFKGLNDRNTNKCDIVSINILI